MYYYAIINEEYTVMEVTSSSTVINDAYYIKITEEQYNDEGFLGTFYDQDKEEFVGAIMWMGTTDEIRYDETYRTLTGKLNEMDEEIATHTHTGYVSSENLQTLADVVDTKASVGHTHDEYALTSHLHDGYVTQAALDTLAEEIDGKADANHSHTDYASENHAHTEYAEVGHTHSEYATTAHTHDYASSAHNHDSAYASISHDHDDDYATLNHSHSNYATVSSVNTLSTTVSGKANASHDHDDRYYTETEIDTLLSNKANSNHNHNSSYDVLGTAQTKANEVQANLDEAIDEFTAHAENTDIHFTVAERNKLNGIASNANNYTLPSAGTNLGGVKSGGDVVISDGLITVNDDSHNHIIANVDGLQSALDSKASSGHTHDDIYYTETEVDSFLAGKANSSHTHTIANVSGLQSALNGKSDSTHNHDSAYDAKGAANTALASAKEYTNDAIADEVIARDSAIATAKSSAISTASSDATTKANNALASAKSYTDTAVATAKNDLLNGAGEAYNTLKELGDLIDENVDAIEALEAIAAGKANASHTHTIANITNLQSALDGKAAASHGTHVSYSTTAPVMDGTASVGTATTVARSDHKHPTDTSRAAQTSLDAHTSNKSNPHSVTLAQLGVTATATELNALDGITATVTELNYVDGVTSNIQTQLNGKAASGHTHNYAGSSSAGGAATSANKLNTNAGSTTQPVYFENGIPIKTTYTLAKSVPADAKFTDTTYGAVTTSANGLMIASDKVKLDGMVLATVSEIETYLGI